MKPVLKWLAILLIAGFVCFGLVVSWLLRWDEIAPPDLAGELVSGSMRRTGQRVYAAPGQGAQLAGLYSLDKVLEPAPSVPVAWLPRRWRLYACQHFLQL
jgi:hypothetical protein